MKSMMKMCPLVTLIALAAIPLSSAPAALVTEFQFGGPPVSFGMPPILSITPVSTVNGLADSSTGALIDTSSAAVFSGSIASDDATDLTSFVFAYETPPQMLPMSSYMFTFQTPGNALLVSTGNLATNNVLPVNGTLQIDLTSLDPLQSGSFSLALVGGTFVETGNLLPTSGYNGFAAISASVAVPEASLATAMFAGTTILGLTWRKSRSVPRPPH